MTKAIPYISVALLGGALGYFISEIGGGLQPNYRWVQIFNETDCDIRSASVLFPDRTVAVSSNQFSSSVYPYGGQSAINIPILASETQQYRIALDFDNCTSRNSRLQQFTSGSHILVWVGEEEFRFGAR